MLSLWTERVFLPDMLVFPAMLERGGRNAGAQRMRLLAVIALAMLRPAATATASSRAICRRASLIFALLCSCTAAQSEALLPSQDDPNVFSVKICQDRTVVAAIKSTADKILKTDVLIAKGMQADDIHMDGVYVDERLVYCSMTMTAKRVMLYRTFRGDKGPRLSMVVRVLNSADFQLIVNAHGGHPQNGRPNRKGQARKTTAHLEFRSNPRACAKFLTRAFETSDTIAVVKPSTIRCVPKKMS